MPGTRPQAKAAAGKKELKRKAQATEKQNVGVLAVTWPVETGVKSMRLIQHYLNSLHVFCRMRSLGMSKARALTLSRLWERVVHPYIYRRG